MQGDAEILRELYMLTGRVDKDKNYLYYLLVKDGSFFKEEEPAPKLLHVEQSVDDLESWFNSL